MRKVKIKAEELIWNEWNIEHIKKHTVTQAEVEEVFNEYIYMRRGHSRRYIIFGYTLQKRLLAVVIKKTNKGYNIYSARDANKDEKKYI